MPPLSRPKKQSRRPTVSTVGRQQALAILYADTFNSLPWLVSGFSTRPGGVSASYGGSALNLGMTPGDVTRNVQRNRQLFLEAIGASDVDRRAWALLQMKQIHSAIVHRVDGPLQRSLPGDGMITSTPGLLLAIKTADCVPVLMADVRRRAVAAVHAGWRGTAARIVEKGVGEMRRHFGTLPCDLRAAIGPCVRRCCYVVGPELRERFESQFSYADDLFEEVFDSNAIHLRYPLLFLNQRAPGHGDHGPEIHLDLVKANQRQLEDAGVREEQISILEGCTACDTRRFFSHRAEFGKTGRMMAVIGIRPE